MKYLLFIALSLVIFSACANVDKPIPTSYIGVNVPNFKNDKIDSLVALYEADRTLFYKAQVNKDMQAYYKQKMSSKNNYKVGNFYDDVMRILDLEADQIENAKFQDYISESTTKARAFIGKIKK